METGAFVDPVDFMSVHRNLARALFCPSNLIRTGKKDKEQIKDGHLLLQTTCLLHSKEN